MNVKTIYITMEDSLLVAREQSGEAWSLTVGLDGLPTYCLAVDPHVPSRMYCSTFGKGLWISDDEGLNWRPAGAGIRYEQVMSVAVSPVERGETYGVVWAGTEPSALFRSENGGETWVERPSLLSLPSREALPWSFPPRPYTHHVRWIEPDPHDENRLYLAIEQGGVMRSLDKGLTWEDHKPGAQIDGHTLRTHVLAPGRVYEAAGGTGLVLQQDAQNRRYPVLTQGGYAETHDGGVSWETQTQGLEEHHYFWSLAVDPADPDTIVMSGAIGPNQAHFGEAFAESFMYRRTTGTPWKRVDAGLPTPTGTVVYSLASNVDEPHAFYAATGRGVYHSQDAGITWKQLNLAIPERYRWQRIYSVLVRG
ncbi:MAG: glycosyl hydrolase [Ktedonobacteraceae bacterium]